MKITQKLVKSLIADGITSKSKVADIKGAVPDKELTKDDIASIREAIGALEADQGAELSPEEQMSEARKALKAMKAEDKRYDHVAEVVDASETGRPLAVKIRCTDPQVDGAGESVCEKTRIVTIQDAFQTVRCEACQGRRTQIYRNHLARERRARHRELEAKATTKKKKKTA